MTVPITYVETSGKPYCVYMVLGYGDVKDLYVKVGRAMAHTTKKRIANARRGLRDLGMTRIGKIFAYGFYSADINDQTELHIKRQLRPWLTTGTEWFRTKDKSIYYVVTQSLSDLEQAQQADRDKFIRAHCWDAVPEVIRRDTTTRPDELRTQPSTPQRQQSAPDVSQEETLFYSTHGRNSKKKRPMVGNYQFVNLLVREDVAEYLREAAVVHRMDLAPFMRWVIDQVALMYDDGLRPDKDALDESGKKVRLQALVAPTIHDVLRAWANENRMKFQTFMRWALFEFTAVYEEHQLAPQEPEEFLPGEAELVHWASNKVQKYYGSGLAKDQRDE